MSKPIPGPTPIPADLHRKLIGANDSLLSIQQMMQLFQQQCEARMARVNMDTRQTWQEVAKLGVDIQNIVWEPHPNEPLILPKQMRFSE